VEFKDVVAQVLERSNAMQTYWGFYITIVLGLMALFGSQQPSRQLRRLAFLISFGFILFAYVNLRSLVDVAKQRLLFSEVLANPIEYKVPTSEEIQKKLVEVLEPPTVDGVISIHVVCDILTLAAIWWLALRDPEPPVERRHQLN